MRTTVNELQIYYAIGVLTAIEEPLLWGSIATLPLEDGGRISAGSVGEELSDQLDEALSIATSARRSLVGPDPIRDSWFLAFVSLRYGEPMNFVGLMTRLQANTRSWTEYFWIEKLWDVAQTAFPSSRNHPLRLYAERARTDSVDSEQPRLTTA